MSAKGTSFNDYLMEKLKDPELACDFISDAIAEHDPDYLKVALGDIVKAFFPPEKWSCGHYHS